METGFELDEPKREVTTAELDDLVKQMKEARTTYQQAKAISDGHYEQVSKLEGRLIELLTLANKTSYEVDKVARVSLVTKTQVTTPKTIDDKRAFFDWLRNTRGEDELLAYQTINYQSLNSLYNSEMERVLSQGQEFNNIPGLELPMVVRTLSVRAK
jgi:hypothetical protein